ncbi:PDDEXK-like family protein [Soonwooa purpurea]
MLGIEHREDETHSVLLADLLSPEGSHGQKGLFLKLFLDSLNIDSTNFEYAKVHREYYIGEIDEHYTQGGRIDILIEINHQKILIENKIYAKDQENQLERYHQAFPNAKILYLTIDGKDYQNRVDFDYMPISYEIEISKWLESILNEISGKQFLQNSIKQYYNLVKNISFTGYTQEMEKEIATEITSSPENLDAAYQIYNNYESAIKKLRNNRLASLETEMKEKGFYKTEDNSDNEYYYITDNWKNHNICIGIVFEKNDIYVGISKLDNSLSVNHDLIKKINDRFPIEHPSDYWPTYKYLPMFKNFYAPETAKLLQDGTFNKVISEAFEAYILSISEIIN